MSNIVPFDESRPEFNGFNAFYNDKIGPYLESREQERKVGVTKAKKIGFGIAISGLLVAITIYMKTGSMPGLIIPALMGVGIGFAVLHHIANALSGEIKQYMMENICEFIGWKYSEKDFISPDLEPWQANRLLPRYYDRVKFEDQMSGNAHGADFSFCESHMEKKHTDKDGKTHWSTVFRGIMLEIDFHREFLGRTVVLRDGGFFNMKKKAGMKRVGLVDPVFEKIFEAYGTDQVEARYLLTPVFMQKLVDLESTVSGKKIRFGFFDRRLHIAVEAPNQFEVDSMFKTLLDTSRTEKILSEISAIFDVIDGVSKPQKKR
ncbi:MAG: hypothetical protein COA69_13815 [Robiginitomaculum sp.]|nr:MAG: hypothetical protein COA69_13815 [Robiginitomaculum sp.]